MIMIYLMTACGFMNICSQEYVRIPTSAEVKLEQKISILDQQIIKLNQMEAWKIFDNDYKRQERLCQYKQIGLNCKALDARIAIAEMGKLIDPDRDWHRMQMESVMEGLAYSNTIHLHMLQDQFASKYAFLKQQKKSNSSCTIQ